MRRITMWAFTVVAALVLFLSYRSASAPGFAGAERVDDATDGALDGPTAGPSATAPSTAPSPTRKPAEKKKPKKQSVDGPPVRTRWGPVQVRAVIVDGRLTDVIVLQMPSLNGRDREINEYAMPRLRDAAVDAQSADIDVVTGATVTSEGYISSLQAALDAAHLNG